MKLQHGKEDNQESVKDRFQNGKQCLPTVCQTVDEYRESMKNFKVNIRNQIIQSINGLNELNTQFLKEEMKKAT